MTTVRYLGLDVHKDSIAIALADEGREAAGNFKTVVNDTAKLMKVLEKLTPEGGGDWWSAMRRGRPATGCIAI